MKHFFQILALLMVFVVQTEAQSQKNEPAFEMNSQMFKQLEEALELIAESYKIEKLNTPLIAENVKTEKLASSVQNNSIRKKLFREIEKNEKKIFKNAKEAYEKKGQAYNSMFSIYESFFASIKPQARGNMILEKEVRLLKDSALFTLDEAERIIRISELAETKDELMLNWRQINKLQEKAVIFQEKAYLIYLDWVVLDESSLNPPSIHDKPNLYALHILKTKKVILKDELALSPIDRFKNRVPNNDKLQFIKAEELNSEASRIYKDIEGRKVEISKMKTHANSAQDSKVRKLATKRVETLEAEIVEMEIRANQIQHEANQKKFELYKKNLPMAKNNSSAMWNIKKEAQLFESVAEDYFLEAQSSRKIIGENAGADKLELLRKAEELECLAVEKQEKAIDIYLHEPKAKDDASYIQGNDVIMGYRIQITVAANKLSSEKISSIYQGPLKVEEEHSDGLYRYMIGNYSDIKKAQEKLSTLAIEGAYIVTYENGLRINGKNE